MISVVIPVYERTVLDEIARRVNAVFAARPERHELIFIDFYKPVNIGAESSIRLAEGLSLVLSRRPKTIPPHRSISESRFRPQSIDRGRVTAAG